MIEMIIMGHAKEDPELEAYIKKFRKNGEENLKKDNIEMIMIYGKGCGVCHMQFNHFRHYLGVTFDGKMNKKEKESMEQIIDRILAIEETEPWGEKLVKESHEWARDRKNSDLKIRFTPTFLDFKTHEIVGDGFKVDRKLRDMLNRVKLQKRRKDFEEDFSTKTGRECNQVACGLTKTVKITSENFFEKEEEKKEGQSNEENKKEGTIAKNGKAFPLKKTEGKSRA